jgi:hypothetical protein
MAHGDAYGHLHEYISIGIPIRNVTQCRALFDCIHDSEWSVSPQRRRYIGQVHVMCTGKMQHGRDFLLC